MKCPKCQYLGFDGQSRCRHCGYDLSLAAPAATDGATEGDAPVTANPDTEPVTTLDIMQRQEPSARAQARAAIQKRAQRTPQPEAFDLPLFATPGVDDRPALPASRPPLSVRRPASDAPRARASFAPGAPGASGAGTAHAKAPIPDSAPPAQAPSPMPDVPGAGPADADLEPRLELTIDRSGLAETSEAMACPAAEPDLPLTLGSTPVEGPIRASGGALTLPGQESSHTASAGFARARREPIVVEPVRVAPVVVEAPRVERPPVPAAETLPIGASPALDDAAGTTTADERDSRLATPGRRLLAGALDLAVIATVDVAVVAATLRASGLEPGEIDRLPVAPLVTFLVLLAVGYLAMCTVLAGRTFGKSVFGLVVVETGGRPVRLAPAVVRALLQVVTIAAGGLGFLPALLGADRRALYDRLAGTEVVRDPLVAEATQPE